MGLIDDVLSGFGGAGGTANLRHNVRAAEALLKDGERTSAGIVGIRVRTGTDGSFDDHEFALAFAAAGAVAVRAGCRQRLGSLTPSVRLGMEVPIRHDGEDRVIIDAQAMGSNDDVAWGYKSLRSAPNDGIEDDRFKLDDKLAPAVVTILTIEPVELLGMRTENFDLRVRVTPAEDEPYETLVKRELVPFYALHLAAPGAVLPGRVHPKRPDKVRIDWPAAAVADPGVGRPPAAAVSRAAAEPADVVAAPGTTADWSEAGLAADDYGEVAGVNFATWVQVEAGLVRDRVKPAEHDAYAQRHGVPPRGWAAARSGWQQRMMREPRVGARFGAEYQAALKRR